MVYFTVCEYAKKNNLTIAALEKKSGLQNGTIRKWGKGSSPTVESLKKVADVFGIKVSTLLKNE